MKHPPITHGLDLANTIPADAWEEFWLLVREHAKRIRQHRAGTREAAEIKGSDAPDGLTDLAGTEDPARES